MHLQILTGPAMKAMRFQEFHGAWNKLTLIVLGDAMDDSPETG